MESSHYIEQVKDRYRLKSDYALAKKLGITQPEANLIRRGRKVPNAELCIRMANLLGKNPVELLLTAQKDKAASQAKNYWTLALTAVDVMLNVPKRPRYLPHKIEAIGRELRQLETQALCYEGAAAQAEAVRLMQTVEQSVDAIMERWHLWKKGEPLYPNYLLVNQAAAGRGVTIRRLLILTRAQMLEPAWVADAIEVMNDQRCAGISVFFAFREDLERSLIFQRFVEEYRKQGVADEINAAIFDEEILIYSRSYGKVPLGVFGTPTPITLIDQLHITWNADLLRDFSPAPLFDMTRYVFEYRGERSFQTQLTRFKRNHA